MPRGGANHITGEGICLEGEPIASQGREYAWRGSQSHHRGGNMLRGGANHITEEGTVKHVTIDAPRVRPSLRLSLSSYTLGSGTLVFGTCDMPEVYNDPMYRDTRPEPRRQAGHHGAAHGDAADGEADGDALGARTGPPAVAHGVVRPLPGVVHTGGDGVPPERIVPPGGGGRGSDDHGWGAGRERSGEAGGGGRRGGGVAMMRRCSSCTSFYLQIYSQCISRR
eukprot:1190355-Prorocentrum_minimum.AAC.1